MKGGSLERSLVCNMPVLVGGGCPSKIPQTCALLKEEDDMPFCRKNKKVGVRLVTMDTPESIRS